MSYYTPMFQEIFDINGINSNFSIKVPYRGFSLPMESLVKSHRFFFEFSENSRILCFF